MRHDPFLDLHQTAERAGYPALLIVSTVALGLVVVPIVLLALTRGAWALVIALGSIFVALALLAGEFEAAVSDSDEPLQRPTAAGSEEAKQVAQLPNQKSAARPGGHEQRAA